MSKSHAEYWFDYSTQFRVNSLLFKDMEYPKLYVGADNKVMLICPRCRFSKAINAEKYRNKKRTIKIACQCGHRFATQLDFRQHYRKQVDLKGEYTLIAPAKGSNSLDVRNISRTGLGFTVDRTTLQKLNLEVGQKVRIHFALDDNKQTPIHKIAIVRSVTSNLIGCEYADQIEMDKALGFYLIPN